MFYTSGYIAYPKKYVCDGACKVTKKGKVLSIDLKYCFKVHRMEISNKANCCSKNTGKVVVSIKTLQKIAHKPEI